MIEVRKSQLVVPAIIPKNTDHLRDSLQTIAFAHEVHIDVVDGEFVDPVSWPYEPAGTPSDQQELFAQRTVEVDLMVVDPLPAARAWVTAGAQMVVFHAETIAPAAVARFVAEHDGISVGISALNDTSWETVIPYLEVVDYVQVMGIATIGAQGAAFDERALDRITTITEQHPELLISVDGSMNQSTIERAAEAGADRFIVGSAIMAAADARAALDALVRLVRRPQ